MAGVLGFLGTSLVPCSAISRQLLESIGCLNGLGNGDAYLYTFPLVQCSAFQGLFLPVLCCVAAWCTVDIDVEDKVIDCFALPRTPFLLLTDLAFSWVDVAQVFGVVEAVLFIAISKWMTIRSLWCLLLRLFCMQFKTDQLLSGRGRGFSTGWD